MADIFIDGENGNNANAGTEASPRANFDGLTLSAANNYWVGNDIRPNTLGGVILNVSGIPDIKIRQWRRNGINRGVLRGDIPVTTWTKTAGKTNIYEAAIGLSKGLQSTPSTTSVMLGAGIRVDSWGDDACFLRNVAFTTDLNTTLTSLDSTNWGYYYDDSGSGKLYVNLKGAVPTDAKGVNQVTYTTAGINLVTFANCDRLFLEGFAVRWANDQTAGLGYGINLQTCLDVMLFDIEASGSGYHPFGVTGGKSTGRTEYCVWRGSCNSGSCAVWYGQNTSVGGIVNFQSILRPHPRIDPDGIPHNTTSTIHGAISHTSDTANPPVTYTIDDVWWDHTVCYGRPDCGGGLTGWTVDQAKRPSSRGNARISDNYGFHVVDSAYLRGVSLVGGDSIDYIRTKIVLLNCSASKASYASGTGAGTGAIRPTRTLNGDNYMRFDSCFICFQMDQDPGSVGERGFAMVAQPGSTGTGPDGVSIAEVVVINSTIMNTGVPTPNGVKALVFQQQASNARTYMSPLQSIWAHVNPRASGEFLRLITNDNNLPNDHVPFQDCVYYGIATSSAAGNPYSANATRHIQSEWLATVDIAGIAPGSSPFFYGGASPWYQLASAFIPTVKNVGGATEAGIKQTRYTGQYGCDQFGLGIDDLFASSGSIADPRVIDLLQGETMNRTMEAFGYSDSADASGAGYSSVNTHYATVDAALAAIGGSAYVPMGEVNGPRRADLLLVGVGADATTVREKLYRVTSSSPAIPGSQIMLEYIGEHTATLGTDAVTNGRANHVYAKSASFAGSGLLNKLAGVDESNLAFGVGGAGSPCGITLPHTANAIGILRVRAKGASSPATSVGGMHRRWTP
ncbi:MAG: hypothetical protein IT435_16010 [Phycisphaerales bacterium]|nr:hypothetical protein [Phycisphaerales bacterium]